MHGSSGFYGSFGRLLVDLKVGVVLDGRACRFLRSSSYLLRFLCSSSQWSSLLDFRPVRLNADKYMGKARRSVKQQLYLQFSLVEGSISMAIKIGGGEMRLKINTSADIVRSDCQVSIIIYHL